MNLAPLVAQLKLKAIANNATISHRSPNNVKHIPDKLMTLHVRKVSSCLFSSPRANRAARSWRKHRLSRNHFRGGKNFRGLARRRVRRLISLWWNRLDKVIPTTIPLARNIGGGTRLLLFISTAAGSAVSIFSVSRWNWARRLDSVPLRSFQYDD